MKYKVTGVSRNRKTGFQIGKIRTEIIDTKKNALFYNVRNKLDVKNVYESFWNKLNPNSKEIVTVLKVEVKK